MKKVILITALLLVTIITLLWVNHKDESEHLTELMRINIESLATPAHLVVAQASTTKKNPSHLVQQWK